MSAYWGKGIATEAGKACIEFGFQALELSRIIGLVLPQNTGSIRVLKKLGFQYEKNILEEETSVHQYVLQKQLNQM